MLFLNRLYLIDPSYGAYFRTGAEEDVEGSLRKRKRKQRVVGAPSGADWHAARYVIIYNLLIYIVSVLYLSFEYLHIDI